MGKITILMQSLEKRQWSQGKAERDEASGLALCEYKNTLKKEKPFLKNKDY